MITITDTTITDTASSPEDIAARFLRSPAHGWSVGIPGAIGEFMYDADEPVTFRRGDGGLSAVTARGAIRIALPAATRCIALEEIAECTGGWNQCLAFAVPGTGARREPGAALSELGRDDTALTAAGRSEILFDLGLGSDLIRFCVRTGDAALVRVLRAATGQSVFAAGNPAVAALRDASPTRVVICALGRVEIYQNIAGRGESSPRGPHTHLLPALLKKASEPEPLLPPGTAAPLRLYPQHPLNDKYGAPTPFNRTAHDAFQDLLLRFGSAEYLTAKSRFHAGLLERPGMEIALPDRQEPGWTAYVVASCQLRALGN